jgi:hypothetical protein
MESASNFMNQISQTVLRFHKHGGIGNLINQTSQTLLRFHKHGGIENLKIGGKVDFGDK